MTRPSCPKGQSLGREGSVAGCGVEGVWGGWLQSFPKQD